MNAALLPGAVNINQITTVPDFVPVTHVTASEVIGFNGAGVVAVPGAAAAVAVGTGVTSATVQLTNVFTGSDVFFVDSAALALATVTVNGSVVTPGAPPSFLTVDGSGTVVATIDLGITSTTDVLYGAAYDTTVTTLNATTSTGALTTDATPLLAITSVTLGATGTDTLNDSLMVAKTTTGVTYNMDGATNTGTGNDTFNFIDDNTTGHNIAVTINLSTSTTATDGVIMGSPGAFPVVNIAVAPTSANYQQGFTTINNFSTTLDTLKLTDGLKVVVATNAEQGLISAAPSLLAALNLAATDVVTDVTKGIYFSYTSVSGTGTSTYILEHPGAAHALAAGDGVIDLVGILTGSLNATNFVHS
jgi:hypothetical protein